MAYRCQVVKKVKFLNDQSIYWGNQLECEFGGDRYFGNLVGMDFIMTCTCEESSLSWRTEKIPYLKWKGMGNKMSMLKNEKNFCSGKLNL